jgi:hypothetical protein
MKDGTAATFAIDLLDRRPALGYIGALVPTSAGFWAFVESATKVGALLSVIVGIAVGVATLLVQIRHKRRLDAEEEERNRPKV